jgi:ATP/maltotriose-dependent transcriptional regulator MalT
LGDLADLPAMDVRSCAGAGLTAGFRGMELTAPRRPKVLELGLEALHLEADHRSPEQRLVEAVGSLADRKPYFCPEAAEALVQDFGKDARVREAITPRERTVVRLIAEGHSSKSIAASARGARAGYTGIIEAGPVGR